MGVAQAAGSVRALPYLQKPERTLYGPRTKTVIAALSAFYKNSKRDINFILKDVFNLPISLGSISNSEAKVSPKCEKAYQEVQATVFSRKILHIDETSHYNKSKRGWCWLFGNSQGTFIHLNPSRGSKVLEALVPANQHIVVSDRYASYEYFTKSNRQACWAHLARDFERFAHSKHPDICQIGRHLQGLARGLFNLSKALKANRLDKTNFLHKAVKIREQTLYYLQKISKVPDAPQAKNVAFKMLKDQAKMWKFLDDPELIPLTNNFAERQIRHYVVYRKNSYFTWSKRGNAFLERVISLFLTWRQKNLNPFQNLFALVAA